MNNCTSCKEPIPDNSKFCMHCGAALPGSESSPVVAKRPVTVLANLIIERGDGAGTMFQLLDGESLIGRWDGDNGIFPEVDLDPFDADAKVSRRHAKVMFKDDKFFIEDLGSINGTFLNRGRRLIPGVPQELSEDDELIIGKTFLRFKSVAR